MNDNAKVISCPFCKGNHIREIHKDFMAELSQHYIVCDDCKGGMMIDTAWCYEAQL